MNINILFITQVSNVKSIFNATTKTIVLFVVVGLMTACGFTLRGSQALPETLTQVAINASFQYSPLSRALQKRLPVYQLQGLINPSVTIGAEMLDKTVVVKLEPEQFERRLLSVFSSGQVAEYELVFTVNYTITFPNKIPIENSLKVSREYQDDPDQILAKSRELNLVLNELRVEASDRLIRLMSSQYNSSIFASNSRSEQSKTSNLTKGH
jgi:LPS-assembly lipoprotein